MSKERTRCGADCHADVGKFLIFSFTIKRKKSKEVDKIQDHGFLRTTSASNKSFGDGIIVEVQHY